MAGPVIEYNELLSQLNALEGTILTFVTHDVLDKSVRLQFKHWDGREILADCLAVIQCNISSLNQRQGEAEVIGARLRIMNTYHLEVFAETGYLWRQGQAENFKYPLLHLSLEGDTCVAVICSQISLR